MRSTLKIFIVVTIILHGCTTNNGDTPDPIAAGSRDYTWKIDTIYAPSNLFLGISGTSGKDVWTVNPSTSGMFYHFDGNTWTRDNTVRPFTPWSIYSVSATEVWSGGQDGKIWSYDGEAWKQHSVVTIPGGTDVFPLAFYKTSNGIFYVCGVYSTDNNFFGFVAWWSGTQWMILDKGNYRTTFTKIIKGPGNKYYLLGITDEQFQESTWQFYEFDGTMVKLIKLGKQQQDDNGGLLSTPNEALFIVGNTLNRYVDTSFVNIGGLFLNTGYLNVGAGRSYKDVFLGMKDGIAHFNGKDVQYLVRTLSPTYARAGIVFEDEVFFKGFDSNGNNYIFHGIRNHTN